MVTASGVERAPLITLESVSLGGEEVKEVQALVHDLPPRSYVDGLLGLSFLRNFRVSLNFKEGILELTPYS
jgi:predicted aspartyl protease